MKTKQNKKVLSVIKHMKVPSFDGMVQQNDFGALQVP